MSAFSIYVHFPFCKGRCPYCDFVSMDVDVIPRERYLGALLEEWSGCGTAAKEREPLSVYLGGGTPSLWPAADLERLIRALEGGAKVSEVTVELNPGDADDEWFRHLVDAGVSRFSVGVQAMDDDRLRWLGRRHDVEEAARAVTIARGSGARSVSVDLIYGTPGQTPDGLTREIRMVCELGPDHVSAYELTIAPDTPLGSRAAGLDPALPDHDAMADLWLAAGSALAKAGMERYEVSSYARPGHESVHNRHYWSGGSYVGLGAGAHGFEKDGDLMIRLVNSDDVEKYMSGEPAQREVIRPLDHARELVMLGLRTVEGVDIERVSRDLGPDLVKQWRRIAGDIVNQGHARFVGERIVPTSSGMILADELAGRFF